MLTRLVNLTVITVFLIVLMSYVTCLQPWKWTGSPDTLWFSMPELLVVKYLDSGENYWSVASRIRSFSFQPRDYDVKIAFPTLWILAGMLLPTLAACLSIVGDAHSRANKSLL